MTDRMIYHKFRKHEVFLHYESTCAVLAPLAVKMIATKIHNNVVSLQYVQACAVLGMMNK